MEFKITNLTFASKELTHSQLLLEANIFTIHPVTTSYISDYIEYFRRHHQKSSIHNQLILIIY